MFFHQSGYSREGTTFADANGLLLLIPGWSEIRILIWCSVGIGLLGILLPIGTLSVGGLTLAFAARSRLSETGLRRSPPLLRTGIVASSIGIGVSCLGLGGLMGGSDTHTVRYTASVGFALLLLLAIAVALPVVWGASRRPSPASTRDDPSSAPLTTTAVRHLTELRGSTAHGRH